jgi:hypothetical protein
MNAIIVLRIFCAEEPKLVAVCNDRQQLIDYINGPEFENMPEYEHCCEYDKDTFLVVRVQMGRTLDFGNLIVDNVEDNDFDELIIYGSYDYLKETVNNVGFNLTQKFVERIVNAPDLGHDQDQEDLEDSEDQVPDLIDNESDDDDYTEDDSEMSELEEFEDHEDQNNENYNNSNVEEKEEELYGFSEFDRRIHNMFSSRIPL